MHKKNERERENAMWENRKLIPQNERNALSWKLKPKNNCLQYFRCKNI